MTLPVGAPSRLGRLPGLGEGLQGRSVWQGRRAKLIAWQAGGLLLAALAVLVAKNELPAADSWRIFVDTLAWAWLAAVASVVLLDTVAARQPYMHFTVALVSIGVAFGVLFVAYIATHAAYSRWALVLGFACAFAIHAQAWQRWRRHSGLRLGVLDDELLERLAPTSRFPSDASSVERCEWVMLDEASDGRGVDGVVLPDDAGSALRQGVALRAKLGGTQVYSESFVRALLTGRLDIDRADSVFLDDVPTSFVYAAVKRLLDIGGTLVLCVFALPITLVALAIIRMESAGSPLLVQPRVGLRGQVFGMLKLRTMKQATAGAGAGHEGSEAESPEARITRVGRWLRRSRFDELPQLWNVLRGEMSLIGPRPEWTQTATELERQIPQFAFRYLVRPGITGWAQVHQGHVRAEKAVRVKLEYDLYYAKNMSLALDLAIGALTVRTVVTGHGSQ